MVKAWHTLIPSDIGKYLKQCHLKIVFTVFYNRNRTPLLYSHTLHFPVIYNIFSGPFNFPTFIMHCVPPFVSKISNFPRFSSLERVQRAHFRQNGLFLERLKEERFWHKMTSAERLLISTSLVTYYYRHLLDSHPTKTTYCDVQQCELTFLVSSYAPKLVLLSNANILIDISLVTKCYMACVKSVLGDRFW
jgi:hypothetical protein